MVWLCTDGWALVLLGQSLELRVWPRGFKYASLTDRCVSAPWLWFLRKRALVTSFSLAEADYLDRLVATLREQTAA